MKIGFLLIHLGGGGAERVATEIAANLPEHEIIFFVLEAGDAYSTDREVVFLDLPVIQQTGKRRRVLAFAQAVRAVRAMKRAHRLDAMISFLSIPNVINVLSGGPRNILTVHNTDSTQMRGSLALSAFRRIAQALYRRSDAVIAVSKDTARDVVESFSVPQERVHVIYNPLWRSRIETQMQADVDPAIVEFLDGPSVITLGRLNQQKGQWHLIRAFAEVKRGLPDARLAILGEGNLSDVLRQTAQEHGLTITENPPDPHADVAFLGFHDNPFAIMRHARLFAFPSLWEGFGLVILEALGVGLPVVASDCRSGPREILAPDWPIDGPPVTEPTEVDYGILMPRLDGKRRSSNEGLTTAERHWAVVVEALLRDPDLSRFREPGLSRAAQFDIELIVDEWRAFLDGVAAEPGTRSG